MADLNLSPPPQAPDSTPPQPLLCVQVRVLVIDDDQDVCGLITHILQQEGYSVVTLTDPSRALDALRQETFHVVLLDLVMPGFNGLDILDQIRRIDADIAVIIITGFPSVESATQSIRHSVSDYLSKPFPPDKLRDTIAQILRKKGLKANPEEELHATIGRTIRHLRKLKKLTLKQLNRRTGLSVSLLSQIERAESSASVSSLYKISLALECRLTELFGSF
jgi:two-component system OmpR family response regulator